MHTLSRHDTLTDALAWLKAKAGDTYRSSALHHCEMAASGHWDHKITGRSHCLVRVFKLADSSWLAVTEVEVVPCLKETP